MKEVMSLAWSFVKRNSFSMSEALKCAWTNMKLKVQMKAKIVKFYFQRSEWRNERNTAHFAKNMPAVTGTDKRARTIRFKTYFDTEHDEFRCFQENQPYQKLHDYDTL